MPIHSVPLFRIRGLSSELLAPWIARGGMDLTLDYAVHLPLRVIGEMLGIPAADWKQLREWSDVIALIHALSPGPRGAAAVHTFNAVHLEMDSYVAGLAEERRAKPADDLLRCLVHAEVDGERLAQSDRVGFFPAASPGGP